MAAIKLIFKNLKVPYRSVLIATEAPPAEVQKSKAKSNLAFNYHM